ncbi:UvrD-helicase domain-containing protein [Corynebacterium propinquum]|uniref:DNA 3'-5' helicase n=1 Tax=Corynebacterium propinquum TaxID=43769 RepID=A0ABT7G2G6_9CORY|nr:UvrD-helicase domain-containing protein [Corynebacterium propinquum]MCT1818357.1 DEAD/DEAH box helicase [Corynebacterium propinquum]MDK4238706.1 UvrD-helicase domain-containing protein [Corynebacterium propinquum]MDK4300923.1 UvrD-helicase domain-containing protein [Corynebacterium propinquum]MDK4313201.1 UvrD-helicase domain-containing protein [Corynebacterium propinquum]MDK8536276.1 UvrD-helicase domain-containing protein [Corynebacterium propinquum]
MSNELQQNIARSEQNSGRSGDISPQLLSEILGQRFAPTKQQAAIIGAEPGPLLVVAGAGAGKTETMAARVVWLVANGYALPEEVLGLTFTRKASQELAKRIRDRLQVLRDSPRLPEIDPDGRLRANLETIAPRVSTYDSYAGDLVREYGLLLPVEPTARLITQAHLVSLAQSVVRNYEGTLETEKKESSIVDELLELYNRMANNLSFAEDFRECARAFAEVENLPRAPKQRKNLNKDVQNWIARQQVRVDFLPLIQQLEHELVERNAVTFTQQMSAAARLAEQHPAVGASQRRQTKVVMLDEYQDTSHAQRVLLRNLFGTTPHEGLTVTAVGDPMQAIYGWRGATAENLAMFTHDFPVAAESPEVAEPPEAKSPQETAAATRPAPSKELTTSWRNPSTVLDIANTVSHAVLGSGPERPVAPLEPRAGAGAGVVRFGYWPTAEEEIDWVAGNLAEKYREYLLRREHDPDARFSAAVLVRKNKQSRVIAEALEQCGVPYEVVGLGGLLEIPEVADMMAVATMLIRPEDMAAALRIVAGPAVGLGMVDIKALAARAKNLAGRLREHDDAGENVEEEPQLPEDILEAQLAAALEEEADHTVGITDAIADLGELDRYSEDGLVRITELSSKLRYLRTYCLGKPLSDLFADIIETFHLRTEVLTQRRDGAVHLDKALDAIAEFDGEPLEAWLDYAELAREHEDSLAPGETPKSTNRVQIMTAHKAKGLEFSSVYVCHADTSTYKAQTRTFLTDAAHTPHHDWPRLHEAEDRKEFENNCKEFIAEQKAVDAEENARLFYVALTRAEDELVITGSEKDPYEHFAEMHRYASKRAAELAEQTAAAPHGAGTNHAVSEPPIQIVNWKLATDEPDEPNESDVPSDQRLSANQDSLGGAEDSSIEDSSAEDDSSEDDTTAQFPSVRPRDEVRRGAQLVQQAMEALGTEEEIPALGGELFSLWERETTALIEEHQALAAPVVDVEIPGELTASELVALRDNPTQFARRQRRPVPFKPNAYAKRGTAFHQWIEDRYGANAILDETELPGNEETVEADFEKLKEAFLASAWADKTPTNVEQGFEFSLGTSVVRGRMDAVFDMGKYWMVVDWKTGRPPQGEQMRSAVIQLSVYREAWQRISGTDKPVRAAFHYIMDNYTFEPKQLPDADELATMLERENRPDGTGHSDSKGN